ncbi:partial Chemotaxis protein CheY, partial [Anaerolineae bacterium]
MASHSILVVDDDLVAAELLSEVLTKEGYSVTVATDGREAVRMGEESAYDIVITDLKMPEFSGIDVLDAIKRVSPQTVVFVITAFG